MKLIASDLDGTLLNELGEVSSENEQAIRKALDQGIQVIVATGRSYESAHRPLKNAGLNLPIISLNGAMTYTKDKELIEDIPMDRQICQNIQMMCEQKGLYYEIYSNQIVHSTNPENFKDVLYDIIKSANPLIPKDELKKRAEARLQEETIDITDNFTELFKNEDLKFYKVLAFSMEQDILANMAREFQDEPSIHTTASGDINIEFNHIDAQKGPAIQAYAKRLGIDMKDVMALGDHNNDESMLRMAGRAVAMGNAGDSIKQIASHTTKFNTEHGFAHAVEDMLSELES